MHTHDHMSFFFSPPTVTTPTLLDEYRQLGAVKSGPIIEYPFQTMTLVSRVHLVAETTHQRRVLVSTLDPITSDSRVSLRNTVLPTAERILESDASAFVLHTDPQTGEEQIRQTRWIPRFPLPQEQWTAIKAASDRQHAHLNTLWGRPDHTGKFISIWDLNRVRAELTTGKASSSPSQ